MKLSKIVPSILSADFANLGQEIKRIEEYFSELHLDIMDGHFVPNISFGIPVIRSIRKITNLQFDVHLMIENPEDYINQYIKSGADRITFHLEATKNPERCIELIRSNNKECGISIKPSTKIEELLPYIDCVDLFLQMTVEPGFGGQKLMWPVLSNIDKVREKSSDIKIQVDGGINLGNIKQITYAGVDLIVVGSAIFRSCNSVQTAIDLKSVIDEL